MDVYIEVQMILITEYGEYVGRKVKITVEQYQNFVKMSKNFYQSGFELTCEDGSYMVFAPEVVAKSVLKIKKNFVNSERDIEDLEQSTEDGDQ